MIAFSDRLVERVDASVVPRLVAIDKGTGPPGLLANVQRRVSALDDERPPTVEGQGRVAAIVEFALDDDPAFVRDQPRRRQCRPGLPVEGGGIGMGEGDGGAGEPLTVQLDRAGGAPNECAVAGQDGKRAGLLVGERLQVQIAVSLTSSSALGSCGLRVSERMLRLVEPNPAPAWQADPRDAAPSLLAKGPGEGNTFPLQLLGRRLDVVAQEVELVIVRLLGGMQRKLTRRKREDEPAAARIDGVQSEDVAKERTVGLGIAAVDQNVRTGNQWLHSASLSRATIGPVLAWRNVRAAGRRVE